MWNLPHLLLLLCICQSIHGNDDHNIIAKHAASESESESGDGLSLSAPLASVSERVVALEQELRNDHLADAGGIKRLQHEVHELRQVEQLLLNEATKLDERMNQMQRILAGIGIGGAVRKVDMGRIQRKTDKNSREKKKKTGDRSKKPPLLEPLDNENPPESESIKLSAKASLRDSSSTKKRHKSKRRGPKRHRHRKLNSVQWKVKTPASWSTKGGVGHRDAAKKTLFLPRDCEDAVRKDVSLKRNRLFITKIKPFEAKYEFSVLCFRDDEKVWTVFQRRFSGMEDFSSKTWAQYETGFGTLQHDFWLGNRLIHWLTYQGHYNLRVLLTNANSTVYEANYDTFWISGSEDSFRSFIGGHQPLQPSNPSLEAGDSFTSHSGSPFSTWDKDSDACGNMNCAKHYAGGWWMRGCGCYASHLNARYYPQRIKKETTKTKKEEAENENENEEEEEEDENAYNRWDAIHWNSLELDGPVRETWMMVREIVE